jgi:hypothetical protein
MFPANLDNTGIEPILVLLNLFNHVIDANDVVLVLGNVFFIEVDLRGVVVVHLV